MKTQIKKWADSNVLILNKEFMKFHNLEVGDWIDLDDVVKVKKEVEK